MVTTTHRRRQALTHGAILAILITSSGSSFAVDLEEDRYTNSKLGLRFAVPYGWILTRQTGYPSLLAMLTHPEQPDARVAVSYSPWDRVTQLPSLVRQNNQALREIGFRIIASGNSKHVGRRVWRTRATWHADENAREVYQTYLRIAPGSILIISAAASTVDRLLPDLDMLVESVEALEAPP